MTKKLDKLRAEIDAVDAELVAALARRTRLVAEVASAKPAGSSIFRPGREADLKTRLWRMAPEQSRQLIEPVWRPLLRASIASQKPDFTLAFLPEAQTAAEIFAADFLHLAPVATAAAGLEMVVSGAADIAFISALDLSALASQIGSKAGLYIIARYKDWFLLGTSLPDPSEADMTIFATKNAAGVEFLERAGYFEHVPADLPKSWVIGIYQIASDQI